MDVTVWLHSLGLGQYVQAFVDNDIDDQVLHTLTAGDLRELGVTSIGHRKKLLNAIAELAADKALSDSPPAMPERRAPPPPGDAERRQLSVLFCDLVGSTELAARVDPEDMGATIRAYQNRCAEVIKRWDGHVAKYMGDGVLAYFGYPRAHEDDAERAVRAGLDLARAVAELPAIDGAPLGARVGIATGLVMVGDLIGEEEAQERAVVGETPNLAARLQALAEPGSVVIASSTRRLLGELFELVALRKHALKGFAEPVQPWRVVGASAAEGRFEALRAGHLTPLVGREHELGMLLERWAWAKGGAGQVVLLSGDAGIGKSRMVRALRERLSGEDYTPLSHHCSPYHTNSALHPVIDLLERAVGLRREQPADAQLHKLKDVLARSSEKLDEDVPLLAALLGIPTGTHYPPLNLTAQAQKQRTLRTLVDQLAGLARSQPVLALYEDVHWMDASTLELLGLMVERAPQLPILMLVTFRPEFRPPWTDRSHVTLLPLNRLGPPQGAALVERLTGGRSLPQEVLDHIVAKTDGVPLFVEELTKAVLESGLLTEVSNRYELAGPLPALAIPATLHDSLMARLDRLAPVKEIAQIGAVIGREFSHELLAKLSPLPDSELATALRQLVGSELVFRRGAPSDATYTFKHALVQDAAYQSLLKSRRQQLHMQVAQTLEEQFSGIADTEPELLAHHFTAAGLAERAISYWEKAGERAIQRSANAEAIGHLSRALELLETLPETSKRASRELSLQTRLGPALIAIKGYTAPEVETAYARARELCRQVGDSAQLFSVLRGLFVFHLIRAMHDLAHEFAEQLLSLARHERHASYLLEACRALGQSRLYVGDFVEAQTHLQEGVRLYDPQQHGTHAFLYGNDPGAVCLIYASWTLWCLGYPDQALEKRDEALALARQLGHPFTLANVLGNSAQLHQLRREIQSAEELSQALMALSVEQGFTFWPVVAAAMRGWALAEREQAEAGIEELRRGIATSRAIGAAVELPWSFALLAEAHGAVGQAQEGLDIIAEALALAESTGERFYQAEGYRLKGELLLSQGKVETLGEAEACFRRSLDIARRQNARSWELRAATSLARLWRDQGRRAEAHDLLAPVYGWFTEGFDTADLKDAKALLDELA